MCDECMIFWKGTGEAHVTFQGRKPTEYGLELKALACGITHIMLNIDLAEGKERDARKEYRDEVWGQCGNNTAAVQAVQGVWAMCCC